MKVSNNEFKRASHIKNSEEYKRLYPDDNTFYNAFEYHRMPSRQTAKKIRFLLSELEKHLGSNCDFNKTSLEHICPYNPDEEWGQYFGEGINDIKDRLGNMVLLDKDDLKRSNFDQKKKAYAETAYGLSNKVAEYNTWDLEQLNEHQKWLSELAVKTWKVS